MPPPYCSGIHPTGSQKETYVQVINILSRLIFSFFSRKEVVDAAPRKWRIRGSAPMSRCTHDQMLRPIATSGLFCCDICEVDIADGTPRHTCEPCDYDLCSQCFAAKNEPISCDVHPTRPAAAAASAPPATRSPNREVGVKPSLAKILETFRVLRAEAVMGMGSLARLQVGGPPSRGRCLALVIALDIWAALWFCPQSRVSIRQPQNKCDSTWGPNRPVFQHPR